MFSIMLLRTIAPGRVSQGKLSDILYQSVVVEKELMKKKTRLSCLLVDLSSLQLSKEIEGKVG